MRVYPRAVRLLASPETGQTWPAEALPFIVRVASCNPHPASQYVQRPRAGRGGVGSQAQAGRSRRHIRDARQPFKPGQSGGARVLRGVGQARRGRRKGGRGGGKGLPRRGAGATARLQRPCAGSPSHAGGVNATRRRGILLSCTLTSRKKNPGARNYGSRLAGFVPASLSEYGSAVMPWLKSAADSRAHGLARSLSGGGGASTRSSRSPPWPRH